jgi:soluble lytic murein transglycosylase-like protein
MAKSSAIIWAVAMLLSGSIVFAGSPGRASKSFDQQALFRAVGAMHGLDPALLAAIATAESGNDVRAVSPRGAIGLMQLMPATASEFSVADPFDPVDNALGAARFLDFLRQQRACRSLPQLIAAYNAGAGAVEHYQGIPPYPETIEYVRRVLWLYLLGSGVPVRSVRSLATPKTLSPRIGVESHAPANGEQAIFNQLAELKRERATATAKAR